MGPNEIERINVARLTDKQRQCMQLVVMRKSSKEIARELGIAKPTVDQRIASARHILGARNRDEAALIFARATEIYDRIIYDPACVSKVSQHAETFFSEERQTIGLTLEEPAIPFSGVTEYQPRLSPNFGWSTSVDLSTNARLLIIVGLTVGILSIVLIALAVAQSLEGLLAAT